MKKYFYSNGIDKEGPVTLDELKQKNINPNTLIWHEGLEDWKEAKIVDDLKEIFALSPPPIETEKDDLGSNEMNNESPEINTVKPKEYSAKRQKMFSNPFSFEGRIRRTEYGISFILYLITTVIVVELAKSGDYPLVGLSHILLYWFVLAQGAKRCHDLGHNGWWQIIPFFGFWLLFANSDSGKNEYGYNPKE
jgi:uncharacterized membrane protein YhaH (DUF805 family)